MNILYIGPYRQNNIQGLHSSQVLNSLLRDKKHTITARPVFISESKYANSLLFDSIALAENNLLDTYDAVIQHVTPEYLIPINSIKKNIAIPILENKHLSSSISDTLSKFDTVLVDTRIDYHRILSSCSKIQNKLKSYDFQLEATTPTRQINIGVLNYCKKIYFIGSYRDNISNIERICKAFIANIASKDYALLLLLSDIDKNSKEHIENLVLETYSVHNIKYSINKIITIPIESNMDNLLMSHATGDIYIDLNDNSYNSLNNKIAKYLGNNIISFDPHDLEYDFNRNYTKYSGGFVGISSGAINIAIKKAILDGNNDNASIKFKQQNIVDII